MEGLNPGGGQRVAVVVAHPDDEALWCGGLISQRWLTDWTIICLSVPHHDPERAHVKFFESCNRLDATAKLLPYPEIEPLRFDLLDLDEYDLILTHGAAGEYGHRQHIETHNYISARWPQKSRYFGYRTTGKGVFTVKLNEAERAAKLHALQAYDHCAPTDRGKPKWRALLDVYETKFDLWTETYD